MAKKQTRRSISVCGTTYGRLRDYVAAADLGGGLSMSSFVEDRIEEWFKAHPAADQAATEALRHRVATAVHAAAPAPVRAHRYTLSQDEKTRARAGIDRAREDASVARPVKHIDPAELQPRPALGPAAGVKAAPRPAPTKVPKADDLVPRDSTDYRALRF